MSVSQAFPSSSSPALTRVARGALCAGCGACAGIAPHRISMTLAPPGYLRPLQTAPLTPEEEALITAVCPGLTQKVRPAPGSQNDVLWGPFTLMRLGWASDDTLRHRASSGGALSAILGHLLCSGRVDAIVQNGAHPSLPFANATVVSTNLAEIGTAAGSRYAPSAPLVGLHELARDGRRFAFLGKPCDVAALRALIAERPDYGQVFPVILSFFCAGVPSHDGIRELLEHMGVPEAKLVAFRYRGHGWPGQATATLADGQARYISYQESWGKVLSRHLQHRCKICADGTGAAADLVCADAWESDAKGYPVFEERPGVSLIVARTPLGVELLNEAEAAGDIVTDTFDPSRLPSIQPGQRERRRALAARLAGQRLTGRPIPAYRGLHLWAAARQNPLSRNLKNFLGIVRRVLQDRL